MANEKRSARGPTPAPLGRLASEVARRDGVLRLALCEAALRGGAQHRQHVLYFFGHEIAQIEALANEAFDAHMSDEREQRAPEALDIDDQDRLHVAIELRPGHLLDQFLERADPARQGDERVGAVEHRLL